jgi:hypothetical protein
MSEVSSRDPDNDEHESSVGIRVLFDRCVLVEGLEKGKQAHLERLEEIEQSLPIRMNQFGRDREMLEQAETLHREIRAEVEPLDVVVEVDGADEDVEPVGKWLQELANLVMVRLELLPRQGVPDLRSEVESGVAISGADARDEQDGGGEASSKPPGGLRR